LHAGAFTFFDAAVRISLRTVVGSEVASTFNDTKVMTARIEIYVQPRAAKTAIVGLHDGRLKIRLAAPPVDGAANTELIEFIAERLDVAKSNVRIVAGASSRRKVIEVMGVSLAMVEERLR